MTSDDDGCDTLCYGTLKEDVIVLITNGSTAWYMPAYKKTIIRPSTVPHWERIVWRIIWKLIYRNDDQTILNDDIL